MSDFNFSIKNDIKATFVLDNLLLNRTPISVNDFSLSNECIVYGAGPSLKKNILDIEKYLDINSYTLIASDGATSALLEVGVNPNIIVSDLDGNMEDIIKANKNGSYIFVHAHGDNITKLKKYVPKLKNIIPTTQNKATKIVHNYGGFTDGDRAVNIACNILSMKYIILSGMDFGDKITRYSRPETKKDISTADNIKKKKLQYAKILIEEIATNTNSKIVNISNSNIKNVENINLSKISK
ncbi:MAG: DUF115 domain-containing protein [Methanobacteriaceae archaeon]|nr:DUF115 domain-containing protein [Methanobacteriaceae archaeon]